MRSAVAWQHAIAKRGGELKRTIGKNSSPCPCARAWGLGVGCRVSLGGGGGAGGSMCEQTTGAQGGIWIRDENGGLTMYSVWGG